jgi:predicted DNA-binding transcriptional regulator AlpA
MSCCGIQQYPAPRRSVPLLRSVEEVCARINKSRATFYKMISRGEFPRASQTFGCRVLWEDEVIEQWLAERGERRVDIRAAQQQ